MDHNKLRKLIAVLGSDHDGECLAAARAIRRMLLAEGKSFTDLAGWLVAPRNRPSQARKPRANKPAPDPMDAMLQAAMVNDMIRDIKYITQFDDQEIADVLGAKDVLRLNAIIEKINAKHKVTGVDFQKVKEFVEKIKMATVD